MWSHNVTQFLLMVKQLRRFICIYYYLFIYLLMFTNFIYYSKTGNFYAPEKAQTVVRYIGSRSDIQT